MEPLIPVLWAFNSSVYYMWVHYSICNESIWTANTACKINFSDVGNTFSSKWKLILFHNLVYVFHMTQVIKAK